MMLNRDRADDEETNNFGNNIKKDNSDWREEEEEIRKQHLMKVDHKYADLEKCEQKY